MIDLKGSMRTAHVNAEPIAEEVNGLDIVGTPVVAVGGRSDITITPNKSSLIKPSTEGLSDKLSKVYQDQKEWWRGSIR